MGLLRCGIKLQFSKDRFLDWYRIPVKVWLLFNSGVKSEFTSYMEKASRHPYIVSKCMEANICLTLYQLIISRCWTLFCLHTTQFLSWALLRIVNLDCIKLNFKLQNTSRLYFDSLSFSWKILTVVTNLTDVRWYWKNMFIVRYVTSIKIFLKRQFSKILVAIKL